MNSTNQNLYAYHLEIQQMQHTVVGQFLRTRVQQFYKQNKLRLDSLFSKMKKMQADFFVIEDGEVLHHPQEPGKELEPVMLPGKEFKDFQAALRELMAQEIQILF